MNKIKDTEYAYAVAKVRAVETRLLDRLKLYRMAEAANLDEAVKILRESGYEGDDPEQMLTDELAKTYAFLREISPSKETFDIFLVKNDYHNIKVILKAEFLGKNYDFLLTESGRIGARKMKNAVENRAMKGFSPIMTEAVEKAVELFEKTGDPQLCDLELDRAAYREMHNLAEKSGSAYVQDIVSVMCDLANILIFVRVHRMGKGTDFLLRSLLDGGTVKREEFVRAAAGSLSDILSGTKYAELSEYGDNISELEKQTDSFLIRYIKKAKYVAFGIEPLVAYLLAKQNEIKLARIILTGKKNGLPPEVIKERLRESYV